MYSLHSLDCMVKTFFILYFLVFSNILLFKVNNPQSSIFTEIRGEPHFYQGTFQADPGTKKKFAAIYLPGRSQVTLCPWSLLPKNVYMYNIYFIYYLPHISLVIITHYYYFYLVYRLLHHFC